MPKVYSQETIDLIISTYKDLGTIRHTSRSVGVCSTLVSKIIRNNIPNYLDFSKNNKIWSDFDLFFIIENKGKLSCKEIAILLNKTFKQITNKCREITKPLTAKESEKFRKLKLSEQGYIIWNKELIVKKLKELDKKNMFRIPISNWTREDKKVLNAARHHFNSLKEAIECAGLVYSLHIKKKYSGINNLDFDSYPECFIGNILVLLSQESLIYSFDIHKDVCKNRRWTCDFYFTINNKDFWIEFNGLGNCRKGRSLKSFTEKLEYYKENNFNLILLNNIKDFNNFLKKYFNFNELKTEELSNESRKFCFDVSNDKEKEKVIKDVLYVKEKVLCLTREITFKEYKENSKKYTQGKITGRFGSWNNLLKELNPSV